ncbi:MAG TPA: TauD/TfdA family dioxygenase [Acidimicrobiales bacterium]|jgi:taurine dioxygenase
MIERRLDGPFGVTIGADLSCPFAPENVTQLRDAFARHLLLVLRDQHLTMADQKRVMSHLGTVLEVEGRAEYMTSAIDPSVPLDKQHADSGALAWHSDFAFTPAPYLGISLYAVEVADDETSTRFASARDAYSRMPPHLRARLASLDATHIRPLRPDRRNRSSDVPIDTPRTTRPAIWAHPVTGAPLAYLCEEQLDRFEAIDDDVGETLVSEVFSYLYAEDNTYEHVWRRGDLVVWDNLALQHSRASSPVSVRRTLRKVVIGTAARHSGNEGPQTVSSIAERRA